MALYRRGIKSIIGNLTLVADDQALIRCEFKASRKNDASPLLDLAEKQLQQYFAGEIKQFNLPLNPTGTEFQKKCWKYLIDIQYGQTVTYKEEAMKISGPNYTRAVAGANNKNPLPVFIPCHRVIGSDGSLVGYAAGLKVKQTLLEIERKHL
ncbi:MAG: cysteine methyltransferase [Halobacteriovoraceae bacterium]|nr:cysteine methyltransferase [Halobacteriovoraceae bacterium]|tara:strand:+ start:12226 stop:12681 length:456 start_codon:yes stop_codon:yes gene_type:complete